MSADFLKLLIEAALAASIAIILVLIARKPLRQLFGARVAYVLWCLVPFAIIAVLIPAPEIVITLASVPANNETTTVAAIAAVPAPANYMASNLVLLFWALGFAVCGFWFARQQKIFRASLGVLNQRSENIFSAENNLQGPSVIGVLQPCIVLPSDFFQRYNTEEQNLVLSHEQVHLARGDTRVNLVAAFLRCVFWFNPLLHWAAACFRFDQELSTDAKVLAQFPLSRKSYADAMLKTQMASIGLPIACHWQAHHPLKERILMLKKTTPGKFFRVFGFSLVTTLCLTGAFAAWSTQPANIILAQSKTAMLYEIKIDALIDRVHQKPITLREAPGKTFAVVQGEGEQAWSYEFVLTPIDDQFSIIKGKVKYGKKVISEPEFKIANGKNSIISVNTKDHASSIGLNLVASLLRDGKPVPVPAYNGDNGVANGAYMMQKSDGTQEIYTRADLEAVPNIASEDKIKSPAKMIPTAEFSAMQEAGKNSGQSAIKGVIYVDASGGMVGAKFGASLAVTAVKKLADLIAKQKYEAAIGLDDKTVASKLDVEIYFDAGKQ